MARGAREGWAGPASPGKGGWLRPANRRPAAGGTPANRGSRLGSGAGLGGPEARRRGPAEGIMVGGLKRKHSDLEEEEERWEWSPAGLQSYQQALLRISLDKVQRSLGPRAPSLRRELDTSMDETEPPQNPVAPLGLQNEVPPQPDPVFLEALSSRYLGDSGLDDFFLDIDTSAVEKEPARAPPEPPHNLFCAPGSWEWNELDHIMEIILGS
ncbi:SERTA domain-containing protein 3 isoform X2 [Macaca nemestrina]|uniref:SERTA domain-containing protein 3 isoform X2 n=1 Tax=Macaca nemestrina TaxID=9545 RepID=UPI0039B84DA7